MRALPILRLSRRVLSRGCHRTEVLNVSFKARNVKAHRGITFKRGNYSGKDTFEHNKGYGCLFVLIFLVIYPATRFRTRLLSMDADDASCCLFVSKLFEKFSFWVERSAVPMVLMYDGFIPMKYSSKFYMYNAV